MYKERNLNNFNPKKGLVSVVIRSGYATQGAFSLSLTDGTNILQVGEGKFGDNIPDIFTLPVASSTLSQWTLMIFASYASAMGHEQIGVDYDFYQLGEIFDNEPIQAQNSLSAHHDFYF
jgi:hypothetical protein